MNGMMGNGALMITHNSFPIYAKIGIVKYDYDGSQYIEYFLICMSEAKYEYSI